MATSYNVKVRNRAGVRKFEITDFISLSYGKAVNDVGLFAVELRGDHPAISVLEKDGQIEIWREDLPAGIAPYCDYYGLYRARNRATPRSGSRAGRFRMKGVGQSHFLRRAILAFPAGTNLRNDFVGTPAETAMKLMVQYNATASATVANGRTRTVGAWATYIGNAADTAAGAAITKGFAHRNLMDALQEVAVLGGLDFDLVKVGSQSWQFRTMALAGVDRRNTVTFSTEWDNMGDPTLDGNDIGEETVAIVGGKGEEAARAFAVVLGPNYAAGWNDIEVFVNASQQDPAALASVGQATLERVRARDELRFSVLQAGAYRYGRDYCVAGQIGDIVGVTYYESQVAKKVRGVQIAVSTQSGSSLAEQIDLDLVTV